MIYLVFGEDTRRSLALLAEFEARFRKEAGPAWVVVDCDEGGVEEKIRETAGVSLFGAKEYVVFKSASLLSADMNDIVDKLVKRWAEDDSVIVFFERGVPAKNKIFDSVKSNASKKQEFKKLTGQKLSKWLREKINAMGLKTSGNYAETLIARFGDDIWRLESELEKMSLGGGQENGSVGAFRDQDLFLLGDFWGRRDKQRAILKFRSMLDSGCAPDRILWTLLWHVKNLSSARRGATEGMNGFVARKSLEQSRNFSTKALEEAFRRLVNLDADVKKGTAELRAGLLHFLLKA